MNIDKNAKTRIYLKYTAFTYLLIGSLASVQILFVYGELNFQFYVIPAIVATIIGLLLGHSAVLKSKLRNKSEQFRAVADMATEFTYYRNLQGRYEYVSPSCQKVTGYDQYEFYRRPNLMTELIHPDDMGLWENHVDDINDGAAPHSLDFRIISKDQREVWISHLCSPVYGDDHQQIGVRSTNIDITERKVYENRFQRMAFFDSLTELPNRRSLELEITRTISETSKSNGFALLFLDLSRFKNINDNFGHTFGDQLLYEIGQRLKNLSNDLFVSRFGGDEFVIICNNAVNDQQALEQANLVLEKVEEPMNLDGLELYVSGNIGIAFYPRDGNNAESLISRADAAMYKTKIGHSAGPEIYSASLGDKLHHFVTTEQKIHKALINQEFDIFYQPKVVMNTGETVGFEALIRWLHPEQGVIMPGEFIHIAEETGQITEIGQLVFDKVLEDLTLWTQYGYAVPVAVNLSARQFASQSHCEHCIKKLSALSFQPDLLELEVTEQVFLGDIQHAIARIEDFRALGIRIALDDFGTGYSSLNYLKELPLDTLKIDISFIRDIRLGNRPYSILKAILAMARVIGLDAIAEGVETVEQRDLLLGLECEFAQGYLFHRPMTRTQANELLAQQSQQKSQTA